MVLNFGSSATGIGGNFLKPLRSDNSYGKALPDESALVSDFLENTIQNYGNRLDIGHNPAVDSVADAIYDELRAGRDVCLMTHSRGDFLTNRALQDVKNRLMLEDGLTPLEAKARLSRIKVEIFQHSATA
jgi:hypothetical protein